MNEMSIPSIMPTEAGLFWDFEAPKTSPVDELLDKEFSDDLTKLDALLTEERLLQEIASGNQRLIDFLKRPAVLARLIDNVTLGNSENAKHVNVSHEVLSCDCTAISYFLVNDDALLGRLFQILDQPSPLNTRLAGYFNSVLTMLAHRDALRVLQMAAGGIPINDSEGGGGVPIQPAAKQLDSRKRGGGPEDATEPATKHAPSQTGFLPRFLRHFDSYSIASAMTMLIHEAVKPTNSLHDEDAPHDPSQELWSGDHGAAHLVLATMRVSQDQDVHNNAADVLSELLNAAAKSLVPKEWAAHLVQDVVSIVVARHSYPASLVNALVRVLLQVVIAHTGSPAAGNEVVVSPELRSIVEQLPELCVVLRAQGEDSVMLDTQWGGHIRPLGMTRLLLAELLGSLIVSGLVSSVIVDCSEDPLGVLVSLFFEYEWNNALHSVVERVIRAILTGERPRDEVAPTPMPAESSMVQSDEEAIKARRQELRAWTKLALAPLCPVLLDRCRLCERVIEAYDASVSAREANEKRGQGDTSIPRPSTLRKANLGYLHRIANALEESGLCADRPRWSEFVTGELANVNSKLAARLGGGKPTLDRSAAMAGIGLSLSSPAGHGIIAYDDDDDDDEDEDEDDQDEENIMRKYGLRRDPNTGELVFMAAVPTTPPPPPPSGGGGGGGGGRIDLASFATQANGDSEGDDDVEEEEEEEETDWIADFSGPQTKKPAPLEAMASWPPAPWELDSSSTALPVGWSSGAATKTSFVGSDVVAAASSTPPSLRSNWGEGAFASPEIKSVTLAWDSSPDKFGDSPDSESSREGRAILGPGWEHLDLDREHKPKSGSALPPLTSSADDAPLISTSVGSSSGWVADFDE